MMMTPMLSSIFENLGIMNAPSGSIIGYHVNMDWKETPDSHIFQIELPGLTKNEVKLEVHEGRVIQVSGCRSEDETDDREEKKKKKKKMVKGEEIWHCRERISSGTFSRSFRLPEDALIDEIKASMQDGLLVVTVPKDKRSARKGGAVEISGADEVHPPKGLGRFVCCKA